MFIHQYHVRDEEAVTIQLITNERFQALKSSISSRYSLPSASTILDEDGKILNEGAYAAVWRRMKGDRTIALRIYPLHTVIYFQVTLVQCCDKLSMPMRYKILQRNDFWDGNSGVATLGHGVINC